MSYKGMQLPDCYLVDNPTPENKEIFEYYKKVIENMHDNARGCIMNMYGYVVWEEPLEEYEARMEKIKNDN